MEDPGPGAGWTVQDHMDLDRPDAYGRAFADVYDHWYRDVSDAEATARFVAARCGDGPVVELGVGSGRLAGPMAAQGLTVIGLDGSMPMLRRCPRPLDRRGGGQPLHLVHGDMRALPFRGTVGAALIAFNTLFNLSAVSDQGRLLSELRTLLGPDGPLIIEALDVSPLLSGPRRSIGVRQRDADGLVVSATQLDPGQQLLTGQHVEIDDGGARVRPWRLRWLTPGQVDELAGDGGLVLTERYGSWAGEPVTEAGQTHVSVYRPAD